MFRNTHDAAKAVTAVVLIAVGTAARATAGEVNDPAVTVSESEGVYNVAAAFTVPQPASTAFDALTDYGQIPRFMPDVRTSHVLERADDRAIVEQEAIARFMMFSKRVHLVLEVQEGEGTIRFRDRCGQSFERYEGVWTIAELDGLTHITYALSAKPSFDVPEFMLKRLLKRDAAQMIERLKSEIGARARQP